MGLRELQGVYETASGRGTLDVRVQAKVGKGPYVDMRNPRDETGKFKDESSGNRRKWFEPRQRNEGPRETLRRVMMEKKGGFGGYHKCPQMGTLAEEQKGWAMWRAVRKRRERKWFWVGAVRWRVGRRQQGSHLRV